MQAAAAFIQVQYAFNWIVDNYPRLADWTASARRASNLLDAIDLLAAGSANFDRMAPRKPDDYLAISEVFHKTFIAVDEKGTEAAAATAVAMMQMTAMAPREEPIEVKVDHPFIYAIQHVPSGACLFIGRVTDPR